MAQERMDNWMEYAREYARAERELKIKKWVYISIEYRTRTHDRIVLHTYDLPHDLYERYSWVIRWGGQGCNASIPKRTSILTFPIMTSGPV